MRNSSSRQCHLRCARSGQGSGDTHPPLWGACSPGPRQTSLAASQSGSMRMSSWHAAPAPPPTGLHAHRRMGRVSRRQCGQAGECSALAPHLTGCSGVRWYSWRAPPGGMMSVGCEKSQWTRTPRHLRAQHAFCAARKQWPAAARRAAAAAAAACLPAPAGRARRRPGSICRGAAPAPPACPHPPACEAQAAAGATAGVSCQPTGGGRGPRE